MGQFNWTYVSDSGKQHHVGLFHGKSTGHLLAHCNGKVVLIDFHVLESKTYPLFIDDELFDLKLDRRGDRFIYTFEINKEADTPRNRQRRQRQRRHLRKGLGVLAAFAALLLTAVVVLRSTHPGYTAQETTLAMIQTAPTSPGPQAARRSTNATYSFAVGGEIITGSIALEPYLSALMPLSPGDEFKVTYFPHQPQTHHIDLKQPSRAQLARYRQMAIERHAELHPELSEVYIDCLLDEGFSRFGVDAYAAIYRQGGSDVPSRLETILREIRTKGISCPH